MSGISSLGSASLPGSSSTSSAAGSSQSLLSSVGQSLLTSGQAPDPSSALSKSASTNSSPPSPYQSEYQTLLQQDTAELLYASFLSPSDGLANADSVLTQAANLLGTPGQFPAASTSGSSSSGTSSTSQSTNSTSSSGTSSSGVSANDVSNLPSVASILAASDAEAQQTLAAYGNAPAGSSIIDYQA